MNGDDKQIDERENDKHVERRQGAKQIQDLVSGQARMEAQLKTLTDIPIILARLVTKVESLYDGCPHREAIARGANNIKKVDKLEETVGKLKEKQGDDRLESVKSFAKLALVAAMGGGAYKGAEALLTSLFN